MDVGISPKNEPLSKVEVTILSMDQDFVILEIKSIQERIFWPRKSLRSDVKVGESFILELKPAAEAINIIVAKAKGLQQDNESMRKLLEELIN